MIDYVGFERAHSMLLRRKNSSMVHLETGRQLRFIVYDSAGDELSGDGYTTLSAQMATLSWKEASLLDTRKRRYSRFRSP